MYELGGGRWSWEIRVMSPQSTINNQPSRLADCLQYSTFSKHGWSMRTLAPIFEVGTWKFCAHFWMALSVDLWASTWDTVGIGLTAEDEISNLAHRVAALQVADGILMALLYRMSRCKKFHTTSLHFDSFKNFGTGVTWWLFSFDRRTFKANRKTFSTSTIFHLQLVSVFFSWDSLRLKPNEAWWLPGYSLQDFYSTFVTGA